MNNDEFIAKVRVWLVDELFRNPNVMFNDEIRECDLGNGEVVDLMEVISCLYEIIHNLQYNESYDYMFHWANKCGSWVESDFFMKMFLKEDSEDEKT